MSWSFDDSAGGFISKSLAEQYLNNYTQGPSYTWNQGVKGHYFGKGKVDELLALDGTVGIRIYYGSKINASNVLVPQLMIVAVDENGNDILSGDKILDISQPCPPICPTSGLGT